MKIEKIITTTEQQDLEILGATLLSIEEYNQYKDLIQSHDSWWWLRSSIVNHDFSAGIVFDDGEVGYDYIDSSLGVCPALKISNLKSSNLEVGDKFKIGEYTFTVISDKYAQCDDIIGKSVFRKDSSTNDYEVSDVKKYVNEWFDKLKIESER